MPSASSVAQKQLPELSDKEVKAAINFYHAKIGMHRKQQIEDLWDGKVQILCCTDAVGMVCQYQNLLIYIKF